MTSSISSSTSSMLNGRAVSSDNPAIFAAASSHASPQDSSSQANREHTIIVVLTSIIIFLLLFFFIFYFFRRSRQQCARKKQQELEEGRNEVTEARAFFPKDESLRGTYCSTGSFQLASPMMPRPPSLVANTGAHPLYEPGMKRSRTLQNIRPIQLQTTRPATSYLQAVDRQTSEPRSPISPFSISSYLKPAPKALSPMTTMPTKRPTTPHPRYSPTRIRRSDSPDSFVGRQVHSVWSLSTISLAPSSSSLSPPPSPTMNRETGSLRQGPALRESPLTSFSPSQSQSQSQSSANMPFKADTWILFALGRDDSPTLEMSVLPKFRVVGDTLSTAFIVPQYTPPALLHERPQSPTQSPPLSPRSPKSPRAPRILIPKPDTSQISLDSSTKIDEAPLKQIEKWLEGSMRTASAFGLLLDDDHLDLGLLKGDSSLAQALNEEGEPDAMCTVKEYRPIASTPARILPIRGMRSSAERKSSKDDIGAAF